MTAFHSNLILLAATMYFHLATVRPPEPLMVYFAVVVTHLAAGKLSRTDQTCINNNSVTHLISMREASYRWTPDLLQARWALLRFLHPAEGNQVF